MDMANKHDPNMIIQAADSKLASNDIEGGKMVFQSALLDWEDDAREGGSGGNGMDPEALVEAIATLWLAYAHYLRKAKQFGSCQEAYESAVQSPVAGHIGRIYLDYARFAEDRDKLRTAQKIYLRALVGTNGEANGKVTDEQDRALLWTEFLEMMRKRNPELSLAALQSAVEQEHLSTTQSATTGAGVAPDGNVSSSSILEASSFPMETGVAEEDESSSPDRKRQRREEGEAGNTKTHVVTSESVESEAKAFLDCLQTNKDAPGGAAHFMVPDLAAAWMLRDGNDLAQPPEPPLFEPSPPKLQDLTGKDILGVELSHKLISHLCSPKVGSLVLMVSRGLWTLSALKEQESTNAVAMLDQTMTTEHERLESNLEARFSVASGGPAEQAVQQMNAAERSTFQQNCSQQRQQLLSGIAWEFRELLATQQRILQKLKVPGFEEGPTVDAAALDQQSRVGLYLHAAFNLRDRIGEKTHLDMLKSQAVKLKRELVLQQQNNNNVSASPPPPRISPVPPGYGSIPPGRNSPVPPLHFAGGGGPPGASSDMMIPQPAYGGGVYNNNPSGGSAMPMMGGVMQSGQPPMMMQQQQQIPSQLMPPQQQQQQQYQYYQNNNQ